MASVIKIKQGDTHRTLTAQLMLGTTIFDLTNAAVGGVTLTFLPLNGLSSSKVVRTATIVGLPTNGMVAYSPNSADVSTAGTFCLAWTVVLQDGTQITFPSSGYVTLIVDPTL
jgi:hypothetical protein